jgi:hypothetical protein
MVSGVTQLYQLDLKMIVCEVLERPAGPERQAILDDRLVAQARRRVPHNRASSGVQMS